MAAKKAVATPNMGRKTKSKGDSSSKTSSSSSSLFFTSSTRSGSNKNSGRDSSGNNNIFYFSYQFGSAFSILYTAIRIGTANLSPITDCDEVFNYWEPLHFLLYGSGMQTWEYAPQYALRTYAYLIPMAMLARCLQYMMKILPTSLLRQLPNLLLLHPTTATTITTLNDDDKPLLFALLRSSLALLSSYSELSFLHSIHTSISPTIAHWTAFTSLTSSGLFHANPAYLPSSTIMILWRLSISNQLRGYDNYAIGWGLMAVLAVGWPFCAVLFVTTGIWSLWNAYTSVASIPSEVGVGGGGGSSSVEEEGDNGNNKKTTTNIIRMRRIRAMAHVLIRTAIHTILIQGVIMTIDYYYYGRIVSPIWNIFVYNATAGGDELYGVEPLSYYIKNLLLNFNFVALLGMVSLPLVLGRIILARLFPQATFIGRRSSGGGNDGEEDSSMTAMTTTTEGRKIMMLIPMYIWMAIVFPRPHKEERFLFPIYPILCFGSSIALEEIMNIAMAVLSLIRPKKLLKGPSSSSTKLFRLLLGFILLTPFAVISISRSMALHHNYSAPLDVYRHYYYHHNHEVVQKRMISATQQNEPEYYVCTAGEWYRFPSSFFLPSNTQLGFLKSSFTGQLPQPFTALGSKEESLTIQEGKFNDMNREEMDRYTAFNQCSYVVELVPSSSQESYAYDDKETTALPECLQYMKSDVNSERSWTQVASYKYLDVMSTEALHRILYIPFQRTGKVRYKGYNLYSKMGGGE